MICCKEHAGFSLTLVNLGCSVCKETLWPSGTDVKPQRDVIFARSCKLKLKLWNGKLFLPQCTPCLPTNPYECSDQELYGCACTPEGRSGRFLANSKWRSEMPVALSAHLGNHMNRQLSKHNWLPIGSNKSHIQWKTLVCPSNNISLMIKRHYNSISRTWGEGPSEKKLPVKLRV